MIRIPPELLQRCFAHGAETYPDEACGVISGPAEDPEALSEVHPMTNRLDERHAQDPQRFPRTAREGYYLDPLELYKLEKALQGRGHEVRVIYHSHPDVGAYFSAEDRQQATWAGAPLHPGMAYLVCGIRGGRPDGAVLAVFNEAARDFDEHPVEAAAATPPRGGAGRERSP